MIAKIKQFMHIMSFLAVSAGLRLFFFALTVTVRYTTDTSSTQAHWLKRAWQNVGKKVSGMALRLTGMSWKTENSKENQTNTKYFS